MPGYHFPRDHRAALLSGEQIATLAIQRMDTPQNAHAAVGDKVILILPRTAKAPVEKLGERRCILRARLSLTADALLRARDVRYRGHDEHEPEAERIARLIQNAEDGMSGDVGAARDQLAMALGFATWGGLFAYSADQGRAGRVSDRPARIERELIAWSAS